MTCYQEQINQIKDEALKEKVQSLLGTNNSELSKYIKPHGFCLGCMLHCHSSHDVIELYSRVDFRCDCGNGTMPFSCELYADKEDYENEKNKYNQNFFDCYCYCKEPHDPSKIDKFMI